MNRITALVVSLALTWCTATALAQVYVYKYDFCTNDYLPVSQHASGADIQITVDGCINWFTVFAANPWAHDIGRITMVGGDHRRQ